MENLIHETKYIFSAMKNKFMEQNLALPKWKNGICNRICFIFKMEFAFFISRK